MRAYVIKIATATFGTAPQCDQVTILGPLLEVSVAKRCAYRRSGYVSCIDQRITRPSRGTTARRAPRPLDVWALLPQSNCKQCGAATCMASAFMLQAKRTLNEYPILLDDGSFADGRAQLEALL